LVRQKLTDLAIVAGIALLLIASIAGTTTLRVLRELSDEDLTRLSTGAGIFWSVLPYVLPAALTYLVFLAAYRYLPDVQHTFAEVWPGAALAMVAFELLKNGFALYVAKFSNYAGAYGALGGILLFMLWTYLSASILLVGAELASESARLHRDEIPAPSTEPARSAGEQVRRYVRGLFFQQRD
jgi:membrane protein